MNQGYNKTNNFDFLFDLNRNELFCQEVGTFIYNSLKSKKNFSVNFKSK